MRLFIMMSRVRDRLLSVPPAEFCRCLLWAHLCTMDGAGCPLREQDKTFEFCRKIGLLSRSEGYCWVRE